MFCAKILKLERNSLECVSNLALRNLNNLSTQSRSKSGLNPIRKYVLSSYLEFLQNYENKLEVRFPAAIRIYRIFKIGFQDFYQDLKQFIKIRRKLAVNKKDFKCLTRKELELNHQMPIDMRRVAPVLLLSILPFANYVVFPIAYLFPRRLLSRHFWTLQQRIQFAVLDQKDKLMHYKPVFRSLQAKIGSIKSHPTRPVWKQCIAQLGSGLHPSSDKIRSVRNLFAENDIYGLKNLNTSHLRSLSRMHNMNWSLRKRKRLEERAKLLVHLDLAITNEGGVSTLTHDEIRSACFLRGLNPTNMNSEETIVWLNEWIQLTTSMEDENWSYILHLPILMAYNHPSNWVLLH